MIIVIKDTITSHGLSKRLFFTLLFYLLLILTGQSRIFAQPGTPFPPPREIIVYSAQDLSFGSFFPGATGGIVVIYPSGLRSESGSVVLAGGFYQPAVFIVELLPGRMVHVLFSNPATLTKTGGGFSMTMTTGPTDKPGNSFVTSAGHPFRNFVYIGATLFVGNITQNPAGNYEGTFTVTFIQE